MMATKLSDDQRLFKFAARAFEKMNPEYRVKRLYPKSPEMGLETVIGWFWVLVVTVATVKVLAG